MDFIPFTLGRSYRCFPVFYIVSSLYESYLSVICVTNQISFFMWSWQLALQPTCYFGSNWTLLNHFIDSILLSMFARNCQCNYDSLWSCATSANSVGSLHSRRLISELRTYPELFFFCISVFICRLRLTFMTTAIEFFRPCGNMKMADLKEHAMREFVGYKWVLYMRTW